MTDTEKAVRGGSGSGRGRGGSSARGRGGRKRGNAKGAKAKAAKAAKTAKTAKSAAGSKPTGVTKAPGGNRRGRCKTFTDSRIQASYERQREIKAAFAQLAMAAKPALQNLASREMAQLLTDPGYHRSVPAYAAIRDQLRDKRDAVVALADVRLRYDNQAARKYADHRVIVIEQSCRNGAVDSEEQFVDGLHRRLDVLECLHDNDLPIDLRDDNWTYKQVSDKHIEREFGALGPIRRGVFNEPPQPRPSRNSTPPHQGPATSLEVLQTAAASLSSNVVGTVRTRGRTAKRKAEQEPEGKPPSKKQAATAIRDRDPKEARRVADAPTIPRRLLSARLLVPMADSSPTSPDAGAAPGADAEDVEQVDADGGADDDAAAVVDEVLPALPKGMMEPDEYEFRQVYVRPTDKKGQNNRIMGPATFQWNDIEIGFRDSTNDSTRVATAARRGKFLDKPNSAWFHWDPIAFGYDCRDYVDGDLDEDIIRKHQLHPRYGLWTKDSINEAETSTLLPILGLAASRPVVYVTPSGRSVHACRSHPVAKPDQQLVDAVVRKRVGKEVQDFCQATGQDLSELMVPAEMAEEMRVHFVRQPPSPIPDYRPTPSPTPSPTSSHGPSLSYGREVTTAPTAKPQPVAPDALAAASELDQDPGQESDQGADQEADQEADDEEAAYEADQDEDQDSDQASGSAPDHVPQIDLETDTTADSESESGSDTERESEQEGEQVADTATPPSGHAQRQEQPARTWEHATDRLHVLAAVAAMMGVVDRAAATEVPPPPTTSSRPYDAIRDIFTSAAPASAPVPRLGASFGLDLLVELTGLLPRLPEAPPLSPRPSPPLAAAAPVPPVQGMAANSSSGWPAVPPPPPPPPPPAPLSGPSGPSTGPAPGTGDARASQQATHIRRASSISALLSAPILAPVPAGVVNAGFYRSWDGPAAGTMTIPGVTNPVPNAAAQSPALPPLRPSRVPRHDGPTGPATDSLSPDDGLRIVGLPTVAGPVRPMPGPPMPVQMPVAMGMLMGLAPPAVAGPYFPPGPVRPYQGSYTMPPVQQQQYGLHQGQGMHHHGVVHPPPPLPPPPPPPSPPPHQQQPQPPPRQYPPYPHYAPSLSYNTTPSQHPMIAPRPIAPRPIAPHPPPPPIVYQAPPVAPTQPVHAPESGSGSKYRKLQPAPPPSNRVGWNANPSNAGSSSSNNCGIGSGGSGPSTATASDQRPVQYDYRGHNKDYAAMEPPRQSAPNQHRGWTNVGPSTGTAAGVAPRHNAAMPATALDRQQRQQRQRQPDSPV